MKIKCNMISYITFQLFGVIQCKNFAKIWYDVFLIIYFFDKTIKYYLLTFISYSVK